MNLIFALFLVPTLATANPVKDIAGAEVASFEIRLTPCKTQKNAQKTFWATVYLKDVFLTLKDGSTITLNAEAEDSNYMTTSTGATPAAACALAVKEIWRENNDNLRNLYNAFDEFVAERVVLRQKDERTVCAKRMVRIYPPATALQDMKFLDRLVACP